MVRVTKYDSVAGRLGAARVGRALSERDALTPFLVDVAQVEERFDPRPEGFRSPSQLRSVTGRLKPGVDLLQRFAQQAGTSEMATACGVITETGSLVDRRSSATANSRLRYSSSQKSMATLFDRGSETDIPLEQDKEVELIAA